MFGNSGTRPFREVAAEAETPKRTSSGVTQQAEASTPAKFSALEPLANALSEAHSASVKSDALTQMVLHLDEVQCFSMTSLQVAAQSNHAVVP